MDGITGSPTLGGVVLATAAAAGSAVYKVSACNLQLRKTKFSINRLFFLGPLQESNRRNLIRTNVLIFLSNRFVQRRAGMANLLGSVFFRSGDYSLVKIAVAGVIIRQRSPLRYELVSS